MTLGDRDGAHLLAFLMFKFKKTYIFITCLVVILAVWGAISRKGLISQIGHMGPISPISKESLVARESLSPGTELAYTDPAGAFSFGYFAPYALTFITDTAGDTLLLQDNGKGIQIYISDYTLKAPLSASLVKKELAGTLSNLKDITMPGGFPAVTFSTKTPAGEVWDVWFVQGEMLYQITGDPDTNKLLKKVVESFRFE